MSCRDNTCEACKKAHSFRIGLCGGCGKRTYLCRGCFSGWVACDDDCREKWRAEAAKGLPPEPLLPPMGAKAKKPKGYGVYQRELGS